MNDASDDRLLDVVLDSWERNNTILVNLLSVLPDDALDVRSTPTGPSVGDLFAHIHYVRLIFVAEDVPECAVPVPGVEWRLDRSRDQMAQALGESATAVRAAVVTRVQSGRAMDVHYDHPVLFLQHMIWHEGYHHGQIKLALKLAGRPLDDRILGPRSWRVWMAKR